MKIEDLHQLFLQAKSVSTDTRTLPSGTLFFALKGDRFNANTFAHKALDSGASYSVIDEVQEFNDERFILVDDVLQTLQDLANYHRNYLNIPIVALTGSNGKTTTKELIYSVLKQRYKTQATLGNLNNHIGVPLTLLQMDESTEIGIVEMGANHIGEIALLCKIASPDFGYITNFGKAHLEGFGSEEGVVEGKSELYNYLKQKQGLIFLNIDDEKQVKQVGDYQIVKTFSCTKTSDYSISLQKETPFLGIEANNTLIHTQLLGRYNFTNTAAAIAIGLHFDVDLKSIKKGIESYVPKNNRSQIIKQNSNTIILDAYNANPSSVEAALQNLKMMEGIQKIVILGDMFELGEQSYAEHQSVIDLAKSLDFSKLYLVGNHFFEHSQNYPEIMFFKALEDIQQYLESHPIEEAMILIKGSRGMALEHILDLV
ncbi:MAG: UDP-N-acetylmuramoyl-tripeptide--D-alanyl-D-alanine ligase [Flavobacteriaceae bacterium]|nr:UDP-N-acetylmuramoyl-tripeptide--D-alanyl-D-alanine ligase [Flavobacteriaceae bacterium]